MILLQNIAFIKALDGTSTPKLGLDRGSTTRPEVRSWELARRLRSRTDD